MTQKNCDGVRGEEACPMTRRELIDLVLENTDSYEDYPFNTSGRESILWTVMKQKANGKILALIFEKNGELLIDLKLEPAHGHLMRAHRGVSAGYHMNKVHWNTVAVNNTDVERGELLALIDESDSLTRPALHHVKAPRSAQ